MGTFRDKLVRPLDNLSNFKLNWIEMCPFKKIEHKKKSVYAAEQIIEAIGQGRYSIGDKLPSEREIAEKMGVSRPSVREALSALHIVGIVESRAGDGTYVRRTISSFEEAYSAFTMLEESDSLHDAFEARRVLEEGIVALACTKARDEDIEGLESALHSMDRAAHGKNFEAFNLANQHFHLQLVNAVHNQLLTDALEPLLQVLHQRFPQKLRESFYQWDQRRFLETASIHQRIFKAVVDRDPHQAVEAMRQHFERFEEELKE